MSEVGTELGRTFADVTRYHHYMVHMAVGKIGLGRGMPPVLEYVIRNDGCRQSDISKYGHMTPATATVMLQTLEKNGFITRRGDEKDQRCMRIYITDEGRDIAEQGKRAISKFDEEFFGVLTGEEQETLRTLLLKLGGSAGEKIESFKNSGKEKHE